MYKSKVMEKETFFDEICSKFNIDSHVKKNAHKQLAEINRTTILQVSPHHVSFVSLALRQLYDAFSR